MFPLRILPRIDEAIDDKNLTDRRQLPLETVPTLQSCENPYDCFDFVGPYARFILQMAKISTIISFPEMLDMTPFMSRPKMSQTSPIPSDNRYSLFAVINHLGNSYNGGHYIAYVRQQRDYWYKCDDHVITRTNLQEVLDSEG